MLDGGNVLNNKVYTHIDAQLPEFIKEAQTRIGHFGFIRR